MPLIAVVTPLFPISEELYRGKPIYKTVLSLQRHADVRVFCPLTIYPPLMDPTYRYHRADRNYQPPGIASARYFGYPALPILSRSINGRVCARYLSVELRNTPFDMILSYWIYPEGFAAVRVARERGKPVIVGGRGSDLRRVTDPLSRRKTRWTLHEADRVLTVSEELRRRAIAWGADAGKVRTILNGCNHEVFHYEPRSDARARLATSEQDRVILFVGWLASAKGTLVLLEAFRRLAPEDPSLRLVFVGEGHADVIRAFADHHGLSQRVHLTGAADGPEVAAWMNAADVLCLPSYSEGCPNVLLEATSVGCPVVATAVGGVPEIVNPENGILITDHEPQTLARALRDALGRTWDREAIAQRHTRTWDDVADETYDVCRELIGGAPPRRREKPAVAGAPAVQVRKPRPRVTVVTPYFPIAEEPYKGHSAFHTLRLMKNDADIEVICPIAVYPRTKLLTPKGFRYRRVDLSYKPPELKTTYFEYPALPIVTRPFNGLTCASRLKKHLLASKPDVILNYWVYPEGFAAVHLGRRYGIPVVVGSIGSDVLRPGDPISFRLMRHTLRLATAVITVSEDLRRNAIRLGVAPENVTTVLNGCDRTVFYPRDRRQDREALGIAQDDELLVYVGWISPTKGLVELIDAIAALKHRHPRLRLALIGEGREQADFERQAKELGISDRVRFLGRRSSPEVSQWMSACNLFCLPSHSEGCPNVVVEAISCGRPVVTTNVGGIPELMDKDCGVMVPPRDTEKLIQAIDSTLRGHWDSASISSRFGRGWESAAAETFEVCLRAAGMAN